MSTNTYYSDFFPDAEIGVAGSKGSTIPILTPDELSEIQSDLNGLLSDTILSRGEKPEFFSRWTRIQKEYVAIDAKASEFGNVSTLRSNATTSYNALAAEIALISPSYTDDGVDSTVPVGLQEAFTDWYEKYTLLATAIQGQIILIEWSATSTGPWDNIYSPGTDFFRRESNDGGFTWGPAVKAVGEDGEGGIDGKFTSFVFIRASTAPTTPTIDTGNPPPDWFDAPPVDDGVTALWQTSADYRGSVQLTAWETPYKVLPIGVTDYADETIANTPSLSDVLGITVYADYTGTINAGQLPKDRSLRRYKGSVDVSPDTTYTISGTSGLTLSINNTASSENRGDLSLTALTVSEGTIMVTTTYESIVLYKEISVTRVDGAPPAGGGAGGGPASDNTLVSPDVSITHVVMSDNLEVVVGSSGNVDLNATVSYNTNSEGALDPDVDPITDTYLYIKFQNSANGSTGWTDVGTEVSGTPANKYFRNITPKGTVSSPGYVAIDTVKTGLTNGSTTYFRLMGRMGSGGNGIVGPTGTAIAAPQ